MSAVDKAPELLPCPFCGGDNASVFGPVGWYRQFGISHSCRTFFDGSGDFTVGAHSREEAISAWNRRADLAAPSAQQAQDHRSFPDAADGRPMPPMGYELMTAGLNGDDACFVAIQLAQNGFTLVPSAPAEVEDKLLDYAAIDAMRLEAFRTNNPETKQRFLNEAARWFQYEDCRAMDRATALTAQQAEIERLREALMLISMVDVNDASTKIAREAIAKLKGEV